jgi:hypothetical protein
VYALNERALQQIQQRYMQAQYDLLLNKELKDKQSNKKKTNVINHITIENGLQVFYEVLTESTYVSSSWSYVS